jgi:hypothetical protein
MSRLTRRLLGSVDIEAARLRRVSNFGYLHECLAETNLLRVATTARGPLCYPYQTRDEDVRERLTAAKVFVPTYWPDVLQRCRSSDVEYQLAKSILPLPIDQRYDEQHMKRIVDVVLGR